MGIIRNLIGLVLIFAGAYALSMQRDNVKSRLKNIAIMFVLQLVIAFVSLRTSVGIAVLEGISAFFSWLIGQAQGGIQFVFGGFELGEGGVFFFNVLLPIVFISALIGILDYIKVLPFFMKWIGFAINKLTSVGELEGQYAIATTLIGQPAAYVTIADQIKQMSGRRLFTILMSSCSTVAASTFAAYMEMVPGEFVVVAVFLNIFSGFIISSLMNPYDITAEDELLAKAGVASESQEVDELDKPNFIGVISEYITNGWNLALIVAAMLIGFVSLITFLDASFAGLTGMTFTQIMGYIFSPIAFAIGVPTDDIVQVGSVMATKLLTNEFVALGQAGDLMNNISPKAMAMLSTYCISFANLGTLGIVTGGIKAISEEKARHVAGFAGKLLIGATLASLLTATIVGLFY
ncbi:pyrimidine nucleoside transporter NupC [Aerococcus urinaehominis]|uniref:Pyrimidine nucleoside transporter NupC n=1 Tax=Aerococcus urinaehominis TaxID=128944 RepID=A0A0X8FNH7_9LACT|nr:nucleoside transporter C-terminal domain-containing protein [Aerococcus urinaehominis]AMB99907.1 pyrimidine nucleoside transporter NupC [Aerococcus urinaehominis]SDM52274.1 nucleoside transport protein [Aerococcus urinaehominis]